MSSTSRSPAPSKEGSNKSFSLSSVGVSEISGAKATLLRPVSTMNTFCVSYLNFVDDVVGQPTRYILYPMSGDMFEVMMSICNIENFAEKCQIPGKDRIIQEPDFSEKVETMAAIVRQTAKDVFAKGGNVKENDVIDSVLDVLNEHASRGKGIVIDNRETFAAGAVANLAFAVMKDVTTNHNGKTILADCIGVIRHISKRMDKMKDHSTGGQTSGHDTLIGNICCSTLFDIPSVGDEKQDEANQVAKQEDFVRSVMTAIMDKKNADEKVGSYKKTHDTYWRFPDEAPCFIMEVQSQQTDAIEETKVMNGAILALSSRDMCFALILGQPNVYLYKFEKQPAGRGALIGKIKVTRSVFTWAKESKKATDAERMKDVFDAIERLIKFMGVMALNLPCGQDFREGQKQYFKTIPAIQDHEECAHHIRLDDMNAPAVYDFILRQWEKDEATNIKPNPNKRRSTGSTPCDTQKK